MAPRKENKRKNVYEQDIIADMQTEVGDAELEAFQNSDSTILFERYKKVEVFEKIMETMKLID